MAVKILHAADFHLDSPYHSLSEEKAALRRQEARQLLGDISRLAHSENVQLVLLSGDLFDNSVSYWETQEMLLKMFSDISVPIFISPGNHDFFSARSPYSFMELPKNVHVFRSPSVKCVELPELSCRVWGAGFTAPVCDSVLNGFSAPEFDGTDIMVLHGELGGGRYNGITADEIAASRLDYLALGHVHSFSGILKAGNTHYAYPGCPEGRGFDETGEKGVIVGTVGKNICDLRFVPIGKRRYELINVDVTESLSPRDTLLSAAEGLSSDNIVRFVLKGEFSGEIDTSALETILADRFFGVSVRDETIPARDIWEGIDNDSLTGLFLSRLKEKYDNAFDDKERAAYLAAARYGIAALERREAWRP